MNILNTFFRRIFNFTHWLVIGLMTISSISAQPGSVDLTFSTVPLKSSSTIIKKVVQPDGKILVFGGTLIVNGIAKNQIARLNADGSLDNSFDCSKCDLGIGSIVVQPDGKIIVGSGFFSSATNTSVAQVQRLNSDGTVDNSFTSPFGSPVAQVNSAAIVWAIQPDGKILVSTSTFSQGTARYAVYRLNTNGTIDNTFTTISFQSGQNSSQFITKVALAINGKILVSGGNSGIQSVGFLNRYNSNGTLDMTFESPVLSTNGFPDNSTVINDFDFEPDGNIIIVGQFSVINAIDRINIARLFSNGNVDITFMQGNVIPVNERTNRVKVLSNGQILVSTGAVSIPGFPDQQGNNFVRLNNNGSYDNSFIVPDNLVRIDDWVIDSAERILLSGGFLENGVVVNKFVRLSADGSLDITFDVSNGSPGTVSALAVQKDGKIIIGGDFTRLNTVSRNNIGRVNADGSIDRTFNPGTGVDGLVRKIVIQTDEKILIIGDFNNYNGVARTQIARLNADGSLDDTFNPIIEQNIYTVVLQSDGKILIGGTFTTVNGVGRTGLARLNSDGSLDTGFSPFFGNTSIRSVVVQTDGKIAVGGDFDGINGLNLKNLVRLNADGTLDSSFNAGNISIVNQIEIQSDEKYVVLTSSLTRLNNNGTSDATFHTPVFNNIVNQFLIQKEGSIIVVGNFTSVNNIPRLRLARLKSDGTLDISFFPIGANNQIRTVVQAADDKILVGGDFTMIKNVTRIGVARLNVSQFRNLTPFDFDGDGRADLTVFRPSNGVWYELGSQNNSFSAVQFGLSGDRIAPADYDGDGRTDIAVFRENVSDAGGAAFFYIIYSSDNSFHPIQFGGAGDVPVSGDWDADGIGDLAVYRDGSLTGGSSYFIYRPSSQPEVNFRVIVWGATGDKPIVGDFDGDGQLDAAIFRPSIAQWYVLKSSDNQVINVSFGESTDIPAAADYDGDGKTDFAVFRPSTGFWFTLTNTATNNVAVQFGAQGDLPVPADYDGDGKADIAVFRPSNGVWYLNRSQAGFIGVQFGASGDKPAPNAYIR